VTSAVVTDGHGTREIEGHVRLPNLEFLGLIEKANTWEIKRNSVGNGSGPVVVGPGRRGSVDSPLRGVDKTSPFASTKLVDDGSASVLLVIDTTIRTIKRMKWVPAASLEP